MARNFSFRLLAMKWSHVLQKYAFFVMQDYLTNVWGLNFIHAAGILNVWEGIQRILAVFLLYLAEKFVGDNAIVVLTSLANSIGVALVAASTPTVTGTCKEYKPECIGHEQKIIFYVGMGLIAMGLAGGEVITLRPKDSDENQQESSLSKLSMIIPRILAVGLPNITVWNHFAFGVPAICTAVATLFFLTGLSSFERKKERAATSYVRYNHEPGSSIDTRSPRTLEKVGTYDQGDEENGLKLVSIVKIALRLLPAWLPCAICGIVISNGNTYFVEQAAHLKSPRPITISAFLFYFEVNTILAKQWHKWTSKSLKQIVTAMVKGRVTASARMFIASIMINAVLCCVTAAKIETRRLNVVRSHNLLDSPNADIPMSVFWLLFQFSLLSGVDSTLEFEITQFFRDEIPLLARKYANLFARAVLGVGFILSVLLVYIAGQVSQKGGNPNWFQPTLNRSRLDNYYWALAGLTAVNLVIYSILGCKKMLREQSDTDEPNTLGAYYYAWKEVMEELSDTEAPNGREYATLTEVFDEINKRAKERLHTKSPDLLQDSTPTV